MVRTAAAVAEAAGGDRLRRQLLAQAEGCDHLSSPLTARLLRTAADDLAAGGVTWSVLAPYADLPGADAVPLRLMAAVHRLVLERRARQLALHYPSVGGTAGPEGAPEAFLATLAAHTGELQALVGRPCQTNEVGRCATLLVGFLTVARESGLPLRLLETGASAGLHLRWDRYRYEQRDQGWSWGDPAAALTLEGLWATPPSPDPASVTVVERRGCDPAPVDPTTPEGRLTLTAAVWADQMARHKRLRAALAIAAAVPARVDAANAAVWLPEVLAEPARAAATVVFQSVVDQYLVAADRAAIRAAIEDAGTRATPDAPLAWLRFEPDADVKRFTIDLRTWPGGADRRLGTSGAHGADVIARTH